MPKSSSRFGCLRASRHVGLLYEEISGERSETVIIGKETRRRKIELTIKTSYRSVFTSHQRRLEAEKILSKRVPALNRWISKTIKKRWAKFIAESRIPVRKISPPKVTGKTFWFSFDLLATPDGNSFNVFNFLNFYSSQGAHCETNKAKDMFFFYLDEKRGMSKPHDHPLRRTNESFFELLPDSEAILLFGKRKFRIVPYGNKNLVFKTVPKIHG
jgi:hypothetical protein